MFTGFLYTSEANQPRELDSRVYLQSRRDNRARGITGTLHRQGCLFVQHVEGPADQVDALLSKIARDDRHRDMTIRWYGTLPQRHFDGWSMSYSTDQDASWEAWVSQRKRPSSLLEADAADIHAFLANIVMPDYS
ncbi:BLUF domain-containing protein [Palleronia abyssalis]|uniref:BLUF domain-containing protein n=1 Tax=Palleronia abyssalis TaxID=1501240 RepID=A0A2R8BQ98_9RHOB|nr:BLUF domain-containing protein [Palleronia abyssalis]SPJ22295.1 hypothetical protein PAA8504_00084 [Palleronia abyssalis]